MKKGIIGSVLKSLIGGAATPVTATISGVSKAIKESKKQDNPHSPTGKHDWVKITGLGITLFVIVAFVFGWIDEEQFKLITNKINVQKIIELF